MNTRVSQVKEEGSTQGSCATVLAGVLRLAAAQLCIPSQWRDRRQHSDLHTLPNTVYPDPLSAHQGILLLTGVAAMLGEFSTGWALDRGMRAVSANAVVMTVGAGAGERLPLLELPLLLLLLLGPGPGRHGIQLSQLRACMHACHRLQCCCRRHMQQCTAQALPSCPHVPFPLQPLASCTAVSSPQWPPGCSAL